MKCWRQDEGKLAMKKVFTNNQRDGEKGKDTFHYPGQGILTDCSWNDAIWSKVLKYLFTQHNSRANVLKTILHTLLTSKNPIRLWLSSFQCPCKVIQLSHFDRFTLLRKKIKFSLNMYIYKACAHNYFDLWLPRLFAFWYFFMLLSLSGQQIISV